MKEEPEEDLPRQTKRLRATEALLDQINQAITNGNTQLLSGKLPQGEKDALRKDIAAAKEERTELKTQIAELQTQIAPLKQQTLPAASSSSSSGMVVCAPA